MTVDPSGTRDGETMVAAPDMASGVSYVLLWTIIANALLYFFAVGAARLLGPREYGLFAALFSFVALLNVGMAAFQAAVAQRVAVMDELESEQFLARIWPPGMLLSALLLITMVAASPALDEFLRVDSRLAIASTAAVAALYFPWNLVMGFHQGRQLFRSYGVLTFLQALARFAALAVLLFTRDAGTLLLWVAIAMLPPLVVGVKQLGAASSLEPAPDRWRLSNLGIASADAFRAVTLMVSLGFITLGDVVLVRHLYPSSDAGVYSGMVLIGRIIMLMPAAVNTVLYPSFVSESSGRLRQSSLHRGVGATTVLVSVVAIPTIVFPQGVIVAAIGAGYSQASDWLVWYVLGTSLLAVASVFGFYQLARRSTPYIVAVALPHLIAQIAVPFYFDSNLIPLCRAIAFVGASFLVSSAAFTYWTANRHRLGGRDE